MVNRLKYTIYDSTTNTLDGDPCPHSKYWRSTRENVCSLADQSFVRVRTVAPGGRVHFAIDHQAITLNAHGDHSQNRPQIEALWPALEVNPPVLAGKVMYLCVFYIYPDFHKSRILKFLKSAEFSREMALLSLLMPHFAQYQHMWGGTLGPQPRTKPSTGSEVSDFQ